MKSLGAFMVVSCVVLVQGCSDDVFTPADNVGGGGQSGGGGSASGGKSGAPSGGASAIAGSGGKASGGGASGNAGAPQGGTNAGAAGKSGEAGAGAAGAAGEGGAAGSGGGAGTAGASASGGVAGGSGNGGAAGNAGAGGAAGKSGVAGASGKAGSGGAAGKSGAAGASGKSGGAGAAGKSGSAGASGAAGSNAGSYAPSNFDPVGGFAPASPGQRTVSGTFDTDTQCDGTGGGSFESCVPVAAESPALLDLCVCRITTPLSMGDFILTGSRGLVLLASQSVSVTGNVRVLTGSSSAPLEGAAAPLGGEGGTFLTAGGGSKESPRGSESLVPLLAGQNGQGACTIPGGRGGGALQISALGPIDVSGTLNAGGEPSMASAVACGGPGGGSGGAILLEGPAIAIPAAGKLLANGASGTGGASKTIPGEHGKPGSTTGERATGGQGRDGEQCFGLGTATAGGDGGPGAALLEDAGPGEAGDALPTCATNGVIYGVGGGGGGGGRGRIRLRSGSVPQIAGLVSPLPSQTGFLAAENAKGPDALVEAFVPPPLSLLG